MRMFGLLSVMPTVGGFRGFRKVPASLRIQVLRFLKSGVVENLSSYSGLGKAPVILMTYRRCLQFATGQGLDAANSVPEFLD